MSSAAGPSLQLDPLASPTASPRRPRWWTWSLGALLGLFTALAVLGGLLGTEPGGARSSSYATNGTGVAAWAELLARGGRPVEQLRAPVHSAKLTPRETVMLLEPDALLPEEGRRLIAFVRAGGRLVYGSSANTATLLALMRTPPHRSSRAPRRYAPANVVASAAKNVGSVHTAGEGAWTAASGFRTPLTGSGGDALLLERSIGRGTLVLLADVSPLQNRLLASAGNAQLGLDLAGASGRPVVFVESVHGYGESRGLAALPSGWLLALIGLALAGLIWIAARARRLGPAEQPASAGPPPRSAYADAVALLLRRTKDTMGVREALEDK
jgi:hypothetical protein